MSPDRLHVVSSDADPFERGRQRGERLRERLPLSIRSYLELFAVAQVTETAARDHALRSTDAVDRWRPARRAEMEGIAAGAGVDAWHVFALNARTEILAEGVGAVGTECSTIARRVVDATGAVETFGLQTWDWHHQLDRGWHTHETRGGRHDVVGLTEHGTLGKIGINDAGLATHFNILRHRADHAGGVPVHVLSATVLEEAATVEEALEIVRTAGCSASSSLTLLDEDRVVTTEITPVGVHVIEETDGGVVRTNHFLAPLAQAEESPEYSSSDSRPRFDLIQERLGAYPSPKTPDDLLAFLFSDAGDPPLCHRPDPSLPFGERWATLATVQLIPRVRRARIAEGSPIDVRRDAWRELTA